MAYNVNNPPKLLVPSLGEAPGLWAYRSTNTSTEVVAANFFSNGQDLGMQVSDIVISIGSISGVPYITGVSALSTSGATVSPSTAT